jgi:hypothetical protein
MEKYNIFVVISLLIVVSCKRNAPSDRTHRALVGTQVLTLGTGNAANPSEKNTNMSLTSPTSTTILL